MKEIDIASRMLGPDSPAFLVAEIGINHNGDLDLAKKTIDAALQAGADAVKFQNYRTEDFVADRSLTYTYTSRGETITERQYDMFKRCELGRDDLLDLKEYCDRQDIIFFSTPTSRDGLRVLVDLDVQLLKNGSDFLGHLPLIEAMGESGLPTILSTGMATLGKIDDAVAAFRMSGGQDLILLHCVSAYPTPPHEVNLRAMPSLAAAFDVPVGFSDHTEGIAVAAGAVTLGACVVEKHFTVDRELPGPDHRFSSDPEEFGDLVEAVRTIEAALGDPAVGVTSSEREGRVRFSLSCVAARDLESGQTIQEADIAFRRPGGGIAPKNLRFLVGRKLRHDVLEGQLIHEADLI